jgi:ketosteroid isomerase-like protein
MSLAVFAAAGQVHRSSEIGIHQADDAWAKAVGTKSVEQTVASYDPDILTAGSAMPPVNGIAEIRAMWTRYFSDPGFALGWKVDKAVITEAATIGYSSGTWRGGGQTGPYLAVWRKQRDGAWKVLIDAAWVAGNDGTAAAKSPTLPRTAAAAGIRQADDACRKAMAEKSLEGEIACYEVAAVTAGNAMPPARGIAEIRAMLTKHFADPNFTLTWKTEKVVADASGVIGYSTGDWRNGGESGPYLAVWRKQSDGKWKMLIDSAWSLDRKK